VTATGRWCAMRQEYRARLSKVGGNALIGAFVAAYVAFRVGLAVVFVLGLWYVSEPIRALVAWLWEFIPAGARDRKPDPDPAAGGLLLLGFIALCFQVKDAPVRRSHGGGQFSFEVDADADGVDVD
jgi:hypothetical protein